MSTISAHARGHLADAHFTDAGDPSLPPRTRAEHRYTGILIAVSASVALWAGIGTGIWGLVSVFN